MPNTIAENLQRLVEAKADIAAAITAKGGTVASGDGFEEFPSDIASIPAGGSSSAAKDVNFYDYDGTIVNSYSAAEFAQLSAMPDNPSHTGLTAQGWNWSLSDAKSYVASYGKLNIGQMYITSDGKTRLYITLSEGRTAPWLKLYLNVNSELDIDWGDGSEHSTFTSTGAGYYNEQHAYASAGDYVIAITVVGGSFELWSSSTNLSTVLTNNNNSSSSPDIGYLNGIKRIEIGSGVTSIGSSAFYYCYSLSSITINKTEGSISGSPWGAKTSSPTYTQIIWRRKERYKSSVTEIASGTTLTGSVDATADDLVVATFVIRGNTYTISEGWTLLGISNTVGTVNQRTAMAYKIANSSSESLTVTQDTSARIYINLVSITGASVGSFSGFTTQEEGTAITMNKPQGLVIWGVSSSLWGSAPPYSLWGVSPVSDNRVSIQLPNTTQPRCLIVLDQSNDETVSFTYDAAGNGALAAASLTITGIPNFWYLE